VEALNWSAAVVVVVGTAIVFGGLEAFARAMAPPESEDPRLGATVFWVWACALAVATYFGIPFLEAADGPLEALSLAFGVIGWTGWKLGVNDGWEDSPREREQIWATTVGTFVGIAARVFLT
jgi:hypothetical protein